MLAVQVMTALTNGGYATEDVDGDLTGTTFAGREVGSVIGQDLVSTVYLAAQPDDDRTVALRVVAADLCDSEGEDRLLYDQFHRHASAALKLEHPNAPTVEEVGEHQGRGYVVSSAVDTMPFGAYIDQYGPLGVAAALPLFEQIADVLDAGQRAGVTHGAVNPLTLRVAAPPRDDGIPTVYLTGHGLGPLLGLRLRRDRRHLEVVDDLRYVAPEQLREQTSTGRTDQYAMACALVHAVTGSPPFVRDSVGGLFGAHLFVAPGYDPQLPSSSAVIKGMSKQQGDRYATCGQLIADIQRAERSAVNRRNAAKRRRVGAAQRSSRAAQPTQTDAAAPDDGDTSDVAVLDDDRASTSDAPGVVTAASTGISGDELSDREVDTTSGSPTGADADDKSSTAVQHGADLTYALEAQGLAEGSETFGPEDDTDEVSPLSEVLSRRRQGPQRAVWLSRGALVALVTIALVAAAAVLWLIGS